MHDIAPRLRRSQSPEGSMSPVWNLKVTPVSLPLLPPPPHSMLRKEQERTAHWEYCFLSLSLYSTFPMLPLEKHWKAAHSVAKHTAMLLMPLVPLNMQAWDNGIPCTVGTDFLTHLSNGYTAPPPLCFVLGAPGKQWKWHWQQKREPQIISGHVQLQGGWAHASFCNQNVFCSRKHCRDTQNIAPMA